MTDLAAIAATIQAAQIQANYVLWASVISAFGIVFAAWFAFRSGLETQKQNNLLEAKREVYLDFIAKYNAMIRSSSFIAVKPNGYYEELHKAYLEFDVAIEKVLLICDLNNKKLIYDFYGAVSSAQNEFICIVNNYRKVVSKKKNNEKKYYRADRSLLLITRGLDSGSFKTKEEVDGVQAELAKISHTQGELREYVEELDGAKDVLDKAKHKMIYDTKPLAMKVSISLRKELGLSTDEVLENRLNDEFFTRK